MRIRYVIKAVGFMCAAMSMAMMFGCAGMEYNTRQHSYPYLYIHKELQAADRAVEAARQAGKDKMCPEEFRAAEDLRNKAYSVYAACHTAEGIALAREAEAKAKALCPASMPEPVVVVPEPPAEPVKVIAPPPPPRKPEPKRPDQLCEDINIQFKTDKADILPKYHDEIAKVAAFMKKYPQVKGAIEGHTDSRGGAAYNLKLSERRAQSLVKYLVKHFGIDASRLTSKGYGFTRPIADNKTAEGRQKNRRTVANFGCVEK